MDQRRYPITGCIGRNESDYLAFLPKGSVGYVDNYYGTENIDQPLAVGDALPGAAPNGGVKIGGIGVSAANHTEVYTVVLPPNVPVISTS